MIFGSSPKDETSRDHDDRDLGPTVRVRNEFGRS